MRFGPIFGGLGTAPVAAGADPGPGEGGFGQRDVSRGSAKGR